MEKLSKARIELEEGRRKLLEKQAKVRDIINSVHEDASEDACYLKVSVLSILDGRNDEEHDEEEMIVGSGDAWDSNHVTEQIVRPLFIPPIYLLTIYPVPPRISFRCII